MSKPRRDAVPGNLPYVIPVGLRQRLDLVHHLIGFGRQIVLVTGSTGAGRSRLLQAVSEQADRDWLVVALGGSHVETTSGLLNLLLDALEPGNPERPTSAHDLEARVCRQLAQAHGKQRTVVLLADDCDDWNDAVNGLLFRLAHTDSGVGEMRVVMSCRTDSGYLERLQSLQPESSLLHLIEIPPLESPEIRTLAVALFGTGDHAVSEGEIAGVLAATGGNAGAVLAALRALERPPLIPTADPEPPLFAPEQLARAGEQAADPEGEIRDDFSGASGVEAPDELAADPIVSIGAATPPTTQPTAAGGLDFRRVLGVALVIGAALALAALTLINRQRGREPAQPTRIEIELPAAKPQDTRIALEPAVSEPPVTITESDPVDTSPASSGEPSATEGPEPAAGGPATPALAVAPEPSTVSVPADPAALAVEPASTTTTPRPPSPAAGPAAVAPPHSSPAAPGSTSSPAPTPRTDRAPTPEPEPAKQRPRSAAPASASTTESTAYNLKWLLTNKDNYYVIQLFGSREQRAATAYLKRYNLAGKATVVELVHEAQPWYVVVHGIFPNRAAARAAIEQLSGPLRRTGPWPRTVGTLRK